MTNIKKDVVLHVISLALPRYKNAFPCRATLQKLTFSVSHIYVSDQFLILLRGSRIQTTSNGANMCSFLILYSGQCVSFPVDTGNGMLVGLCYNIRYSLAHVEPTWSVAAILLLAHSHTDETKLVSCNR